MHVVTHLLIGWTVAEHAFKMRRDRALVAWASVGPDIDGTGLLVNGIARPFGQNWGLYEQFHRVALRGLPGAILSCPGMVNPKSAEQDRRVRIHAHRQVVGTSAHLSDVRLRTLESHTI